MNTIVLLLLLSLTLLAQDSEDAPVLSAATILKPEFAAGVLSGEASPMAPQELQEAGITLAPRLAPGPLQ